MFLSQQVAQTSTLQPKSAMEGQSIAGGAKGKTICENLFSPKGVANMAGLRNPTPPQTNSDATSGSSNSNRFSMLQGNKDESESDAATDVAPAGKIAGGSQQGVVATHADSNEATGDVQGQVSEPEVEGGVVPQEEDLQPDEVVSLKEVDFHKAESK